MTLFYWIWGLMKTVAGIVFPVFSGAASGVVRSLRWIFHVLFVLIILVLLWYLNGVFDLERALHSNFPALHSVWLPMLFLMLYVLCWVGYWLYKLLGPERVTSEFPDIDAAWAEAMQALAQASIDFTDAPLFLVLGKPAQSEEGLFNAARIPFGVHQTPNRADSPLHVYAHRDGIYITVPGASLLARQASLFAEKPDFEPEPDFEESYTPPPPETPAKTPAEKIQAILAKAKEDGRGPDQLTSAEKKTIADLSAQEKPNPTTEKIQAVIAKAQKDGRGPDQLTDAEKKEISDIATQEAAAPEPEPNAEPEPEPDPESSVTLPSIQEERRRPLLKDKAKIAEITARLTYVCQYIARERRPYCAVNGVLVLIPYAATDGDIESSHTASLWQTDMETAREVLQVDCPLIALVCDMENAPGFHELVQRLPKQQRDRALGQRFPLVPDVDPPEIAPMIENGIRWVCEERMPAAIYPMLRLSENVTFNGEGKTDPILEGNGALYQFMSQMRERQHRLGRLVHRGTSNAAGEAPLIGGCFFAGTGPDVQRDQAFVAEVFYELLRNQNFVSWTGQALSDEASYRRWVQIGITSMVVLVVSLIAAGIYFWNG